MFHVFYLVFELQYLDYYHNEHLSKQTISLYSKLIWKPASPVLNLFIFEYLDEIVPYFCLRWKTKIKPSFRKTEYNAIFKYIYQDIRVYRRGEKTNRHWSMIGKMLLHMGRTKVKWDVDKQVWFVASSCLVWGEVQPHENLCLETVFPAYKLTQNCYVNMKILISLKLET